MGALEERVEDEWTELPTVLGGRFALTDILPESPVGPAFLASDKSYGEMLGSLQVLVSVFLISASAKEASDALRALPRQVETAKSLSHRNLVRIFDLNTEAGESAVTAEPLYGIPLARRLERGPLPIVQAVQILRDVAAALEYVDRSDLVLESLSASQVFIAADGSVKLVPVPLLHELPGNDAAAQLYNPHTVAIRAWGRLGLQVLGTKKPGVSRLGSTVRGLLSLVVPSRHAARLMAHVERAMGAEGREPFESVTEIKNELVLLGQGLGLTAEQTVPDRYIERIGSEWDLSGVHWTTTGFVAVLALYLFGLLTILGNIGQHLSTVPR